MAPAPSPFFQDHSFDPFLFAAIGEEQNGMLLSVLSALARLDLDPWYEAASLEPAAGAGGDAATDLVAVLFAQRATQGSGARHGDAIGRALAAGARDVPWSRGAAVVSNSKMSWPMVGLIVVAFVMMFGKSAARHESKGSGLASPATSVIDPGAAKAQNEQSIQSSREATDSSIGNR